MGQRSTATANASAAISSAMYRSPKRLVSTLAVDDGRGRGRRQAVGEQPVALLLQPLLTPMSASACFIASLER